MTGRPGRTGTPKWKKDLKICEMWMRKTMQKGHLERPYEELSRADPALHTYWEQNGNTLINLILKAPMLILQNFVKWKRSILAFVKWWPVEFGDISVPLLQKNLLRLERGQMRDIESIEKVVKRKARWHLGRENASCERQKPEQKI